MTKGQAMRLAGACERAIEIVEEAVATLSAARELFRSVHGAWMVGAELRDAVGYSRLAQFQLRMIHDKLAVGELTPSPTRPARFTENHAEYYASKQTPGWRARMDHCNVPSQRPQAGVAGAGEVSLAAVVVEAAVVVTEVGS